MSSSPSSDESIQLFHHGGGTLCLATKQEREAFCRGRLETAADLAELCAMNIKEENASLHTTLCLIASMLHEANEAMTAGS